MIFHLDRKKIFTIPLILLLIYSAFIPMHLSNYVLCIGEDGHVKFEAAVNGCCVDAPTHDFDHPETTAEDEDHCGECIDLPIFASLNTEPIILSVKNDLLTHEVISSAALISHETTVSTILTTTPFLVTPPLIDPTLIALRTVTLLI